MTANDLRQKYLDFFERKGHAIISSASLIPENDPTVLFTTAGMHPLVPYLLGEKHPSGARLVNAQKCIRTGDIDEVGDRTHHTFFEMMGNWSLGDYFKNEAIQYSFEFLTSATGLGLDKNRLAVSVFVGDEDAPYDLEAYEIWAKIFTDNNLPLERIAKLPKKNNWWGPAGTTGPCGPDSEMFYWTGDENKIPLSFNDDNDLWVEIWNDVFMQYNKNEEGKYEPLRQKNIDTGLGLERVLAIKNGFSDNYQTELFINLINRLEELSGHKYDETPEVTRMMRIVADHLKAATFIIGDNKGISPSNTDQGYVVRRLIRRAILQGKKLGINQNDLLWPLSLASQVAQDYSQVYPELENNWSFIKTQLEEETGKFQKSLEKGLIEFNKLVGDGISGEEAFMLYQSHGFPLELTEELAQEKNVKVDVAGFEEELKKHQDLSRTAAAGKFKGGLADAGEETTKLHTAAHLLLAALRKVLGPHVTQKGSNITSERLRFDFSHPEKMMPEQIKQVEDLVNGAIAQNHRVVCEELSLEDAKNRGAMGVFDSKYGEKVKVYTICHLENHSQVNFDSAFSQEICGGPHVSEIGILGHFKIQKEESSSSGVRRIKAILEK